MLPIRRQERWAQPTYVHQDTDFVGPKVPSSAPPGSFAFSGHDKPHAHMIHADPSNRFVLQTIWGRIGSMFPIWMLRRGKLSPVSDSPFSVPPGTGHATSRFMAMVAGYIHCRKKHRR